MSATHWSDDDLAANLQLPVSWVARQARQGFIPHAKFGRYRRYDTTSPDFQSWLESTKAKSYSAEREKAEPDGEDDMARMSYQTGSIRKRESKKLGTIFELRFRLHNQEKTEILRDEKGELCRTEKAANKASRIRMDAVNRVNNRLQADITFKQFVETRWKDYISHLKYVTIAGYEYIINHHWLPVVGHKPMREITPADIADVLKQAEKTRKTGTSLMMVYQVGRSLFDVAEQYEYIERSPVRPKIHKPNPATKEKVVLSADQIVRLIEHSEGEARLILLCFAVTGMRAGELASLKRRCLDFDAQTLTIDSTLCWKRRMAQSPKTKSSNRTLRLPEPLLSELKLHCQFSRFIGSDDYVFCDMDGRPYQYHYLRDEVLIPAFEKAGIVRLPHVHGFHLFRHSVATLLDELTEGLRAGQGLLGHASEGQTAEYTHRHQAVEASELLARKLVSCGLAVAKTSETVQ